jgi:crotonobetainyl-CoA:carnitine CoA-transferase CaiB-like acyl-CoA transferase
LCTQLLGDLGAEIIQLERPGGDPQRSVNEWLFRAASLGKKSVEIDLKEEAGRESARRLIEDSHVFLEGFRPGVAARLGMGVGALSEVNPRLVYCSISGYGQTGPYRLVSGHNVNYEAVAGVLDASLRPDLGVSYFAAAPPLGDIVSGMTAALGIMAGLRSVEADGKGVYLDVSIVDSLALALAPNITRALNGHDPWSVREPAYGIFESADGWVALGISYEDHFWRHLCEVLGFDDLLMLSRPERIARRDAIRRRVSEALCTRPTAYWVESFGDLVPCSPVNRLHDVEHDAQIVSRNLIVSAVDEAGRDFRTVASPFSRVSGKLDDSARRRVPALGSANEDLAGLTPLLAPLVAPSNG